MQVHGANLVPAERRRRKQAARHKALWMRFGVAYLVVLAAGLIAILALLDEDDTQVRKQYEQCQDRIERSEQELRALDHALNETKSALAAAEAIRGQPNWSYLLALLGREVQDEIVLKACGIAPLKKRSASAEETAAERQEDSFVVTLDGLGQSPTAVSQFILRLEQVGIFDRVGLTHTTRHPALGGGVVGFQLACVLGAEGGHRE